ncbi:MAG: DUF58 domain-containing protein [bacterium]|nr:DUF58 domain-containing protein [bacterium]
MVLAAGFNTRSNLLFFVGYLLGGIFILSFIFAFRNMSRLHGKRNVEGITFQNETVTVELEMTSDSNASFIKIRDRFNPGSQDDQKKELFIYNLNKFGMKISYDAIAYRRGKFKIGPIEAESEFPFLLFTRKRVLNIYSDILVYPEIFDMKNFPLYEQIVTSSINKIITSVGGGNEFFGIRDYKSGDSMRTIDWKVSARMNQLVVKEFEKQLGHSTYILLDIAPGNNSGSSELSSFEKSVNIAGSVLKNRIDGIDNVGFIWDDQFILPESGKEQLYHILDKLAVVSIEKNDPLTKSYINAAKIIDPENILVIISRTIDENYLKYLNLLAAKKIRIIFIYVIPESFSKDITRENLTTDIKERFTEISLTGAKLYPYYRDDLISEIFNQGL